MPSTRKFEETLEYISSQVSSSLAIDLFKKLDPGWDGNDTIKVDQGLINAISTKGAGVMVGNATNRRRALRALLLCQKTYLSEPRPPFNLKDIDAIKPGGWPKATVDHWNSRSETEIKRAIKMYMPLPNASAVDIVAAARTHGPTQGGVIDNIHRLTREDGDFPVETTCYRAVQTWMLLAGLVSLQWFQRCFTLSPNGQMTQENCVSTQLLRYFGQGTTINVTRNPQSINIPAGKVVYMYRGYANGTPNPAGQLGHWMASSGNNMGYGCNNFFLGVCEGVNSTYAHTDIVQQIRGMQANTIVPDVPDHHFLRVFDPKAIEKFPD